MRRLPRLRPLKEVAEKSIFLAPTKRKIIDMLKLRLRLTRKAREE